MVGPGQTHVLETRFERLADVVIDHAGDTLDAAAAGETAYVWLGC